VSCSFPEPFAIHQDGHAGASRWSADHPSLSYNGRCSRLSTSDARRHRGAAGVAAVFAAETGRVTLIPGDAWRGGLARILAAVLEEELGHPEEQRDVGMRPRATELD
jgi:hypothetical protein